MTHLSLSRGLSYCLIVLIAACGDQSAPAVDGPRGELLCQPFETVVCDCDLASGTQYCLGDGSGYSACSCPVKVAVTRPDESVALFELSTVGAQVDGRTLSVPAGSPLESSEVGDILVSFEGAGFLGRVSSLQTQSDGVAITTEEIALADAFEELEVDVMHDAPLQVWLPPEVRDSFGETPNALSGGLDFSGAGSITPGFRIREGSTLDLEGPKIEAGFSIGRTGSVNVGLFDLPKYGLRSFKFIVNTGVDLRLNSTVSVEAQASGTASIELIEAALTAAGKGYLAPARYPIGGGLEAVFYFYLECGVEVTGSADLDTFVEIESDVQAGLRFNFDRSPKWRGVGDVDIDADAGLDDFDWQANGQVLCQIKPEIELMMLRSSGPFVNAGPYFLTQGQAGPRYRIEIGGGFRGDVGGRINVLDFGTVWEETWELFDFYQEFWSQDFAVCGDGYLQPGEECDAGFIIDTEQCSASCECEIGYLPRADDIGFDDNLDNRPGDWASFNFEGRINGCRPSCSDGIVQSEEGEVCDEGLSLARGRGYNSCDRTCTRRFCVCGDGIVDNAGGNAFEAQTVSFREGRVTSTTVVLDDSCAEVCDDGNTESGDGCRADCLGVETCGDYLYDPGEECDLGAGNGGETWCLDGCLLDLGCGDGRVAPDEECDSGGVNSSTCNFNCTLAECGDGYVNPAAGEECDDPASPRNCKPDCTIPACGDGYVSPGEECDTGGASATCDSDCTLAFCGDNTINPAAGEECEPFTPGGPVNTAQCNFDCTVPVCGDGVVNAAANEVCDDADTDDCTPACNSVCTGPGNQCGDGFLRCDEVCDDNNTTAGDGCRADCMGLEVCGDGLIDVGEVCDDGNTVSGDGCRADCLGTEVCGDNLVDIGEVCDDGNNDNCDGDCLADCSAERADTCGDGAVTEPCPGCDVCEVCEDTVVDNTDVDLGCSPEAPNCNECGGCTEDVCGDGIIGPSEFCDGNPYIGFCFGESGDYVRCVAPHGSEPGERSECAPDSLCLAAVGFCIPDPLERSCVTFGPESCGTDSECQILGPYPGDCNSSCTRIVTCGDGFVDAPEECEPTCQGGTLDDASCLGDAARAACSDGGGSCNACSDFCEDALCGNGRRELPMEQCDPSCLDGSVQSCAGIDNRTLCVASGGFCSSGEECTASCREP